jgi:hypothetical protein
VKVSAAVICTAAWTLAAITQLVFVLGLPTGKVVAFGVDISQETHMSLVEQAVYIAVGLALALAACVSRRWRFPLLIGSSLFYLAHWFPWRLLGRYGIVATVKSMYLIGSITGLRFTSFVRDVVLPLAFAAVIIMSISEWRRPVLASAKRQ